MCEIGLALRLYAGDDANDCVLIEKGTCLGLFVAAGLTVFFWFNSRIISLARSSSSSLATDLCSVVDLCVDALKNVVRMSVFDSSLVASFDVLSFVRLRLVDLVSSERDLFDLFLELMCSSS